MTGYGFPESAVTALAHVTRYAEWRRRPIGRPVALKAIGATIVHKSDVGGVMVEMAADMAFRLHPLTDRDTREMIDELRGARLLRGFRGASPADEAALRDVLLRLSALLDLCPEIQELDINPLRVLTTGVVAVDARVRTERAAAPLPTRRITY